MSQRMERTYSDAVATLNTVQSNYAVVNAIRASGRSLNQQAIPEMIEWCRKIGYEPSDFNRLRLIHIAGTKGKGSTSAFISSILAQYLPSASQPSPVIQKVGLYTSPHLRFVRERIQINNQPLSEEEFAKYFFQIWDRLEDAARSAGQPIDTSAKPVYFRFLTLMAFHTYMTENVDTAIIECGIGGEYDSTNILVSPTVTGITSLGIDHTAILGTTIEDIAWHKAGIMKPNVPAFTVPQPAAALAVLHQRAAEIGAPLHVVPIHPELDTIQLGLAADFQKLNASLAIQIAAAHLRTLGQPNLTTDPLPAEFKRGLEQVRWSGRCETRRERGIAWHLDGGHTLESIELAAKWFASQIPPVPPSLPSSLPSNPNPRSRRKRVLLFNQQTRDASALALALHSTLSAALRDEQPFTHAVFCSNVTFKDRGYKPDLVSMNTSADEVGSLGVQWALKGVWERVDARTEVVVRGTVEEAVGWVRGLVGGRAGEGMGQEDGGAEEEEVMVLVTGSVHLVGGVLEVLETGG